MWQGAFENDTSSPSILAHVMHEMYTAPCGLDLTTQATTLRETARLLAQRLRALSEDMDGTLRCLAEYASHYK